MLISDLLSKRPIGMTLLAMGLCAFNNSVNHPVKTMHELPASGKR